MDRIQVSIRILAFGWCCSSLTSFATDFFDALDQVTHKFSDAYPHSEIHFSSLKLSPNLPKSLGPQLLYLLQKRVTEKHAPSNTEEADTLPSSLMPQQAPSKPATSKPAPLPPPPVALSLNLVRDDLILDAQIQDPSNHALLWAQSFQVRNLNPLRSETEARTALLLNAPPNNRRFEGLLSSQMRYLSQGSWIASVQPTLRYLRRSNYGRSLTGFELASRIPVSFFQSHASGLSEPESAFRFFNLQAGFTQFWALFKTAEALRSFHHRLGFALGLDLTLPRFWTLYGRLFYEFRFSKAWVASASIAAHPIGAARSASLSVRGIEFGLGMGLGF